MASNLIWYDSTGTTEQSTISFSVAPGGTSSAVALRLVNEDSGGTTTATQPVVLLRQVNGSGVAVTSGLRPVDERWVRMRTLGGGSAGSTQPAIGFTPIGRNRWFELSELAADDYHDIEFDFQPPGSAPAGEYTFLVDVLPGPTAFATSLGISDSRRDGVLSYLGDASRGQILSGGAVVESGTPDSDVNIERTVYEAAGIRGLIDAQAITLNQQDGSSATLGSGEEYWALITATDSGHSVTKSDKGTSPLDVSNRPAIPLQEIGICYVRVDDSATIEDADITRIEQVGAHAYSSSSLNLTVGPGRCLVDNAVTRDEGQTVIALTDSATNYVFKLGDGSYSVNTTGTRPDVRALLLHEHTTSGGAVTSSTDRRELIGAEPHILAFQFHGTLAADDEVHISWPFSRAGYIRGIVPLILTAGTAGGSTTGTAEFRFELDYSDAGGAWTGLIDSADRPGLTPTDVEDRSGAVNAFAIPAYSRLRAVAKQIVAYTVTEEPQDVTLLLAVDLV